MLPVLLAGAVGLAVASPALAVHDTGAFELDGNATNNPAVAGDDWDNVCHQVLGTDCSTSSNTTGATAVDWVAEPSLDSTIFTGGGSKDPNDISSWQWKDGAGGLPAKDNLLHSFAARYKAVSGPDAGDEVLFFGSDRWDNSGDAQQGFWFFQNEVKTVGTGSGSFSGVHRNGDLLVISDFSNGGTTSTITVYVWDTSCTSADGPNPTAGQCGATNLRLKATSDNANCGSAPAGDDFCGIVNSGTITMPWSFTDKSGTPGNQALNGEFYEGGVNLTDLGLGNTCFASVAAESRASTSPTATLKDFVLGGFGKCTTTLTTTPTAAGPLAIPTDPNSAQISVTDTANLTVQGVALFSGTISFHLCGPLDATSTTATCATGGVDVGSKAVSTNGPVVSPAATVSAAGQYCWRADFTSTTTGVPPASDASHNECFIVTPAPTSLVTHAGPPVQLGNPITDTADLSGTAHKPGIDGPAGDSGSINATTDGGDATGTITFKLFKGSDCTTPVFTSAEVPVSGDGTYGPVSFTPTSPGTYHWSATYSGDSPNTLGTSDNTDCTAAREDVIVSDTTSMASQQTWQPNDSATVTATGGAALNGTLSAQLYTGDNCGATSGSAVSGQLYTKTLTNATTAAERTLTTNNTTFTVTASSSVSWLVKFDSTDGNVVGSSHCESTSLTITN
jgi:hypothetical protein